jgi:carbon-monoxide dehydrogenase medium subunit
MYLPEFEYKAPRTVDELKSLLAQYGEQAKILSGGTDLVLSMKRKELRPACVIDVGRIGDLEGIRRDSEGGLVIGACTRFQEIEASEAVAGDYAALTQAVSSIGSPQVRAMATIGGNSCTASPSADSPPALIAFGARVKLVGQNGEREMPLEEFIQGNRTIALQADEYLESFLLDPPWPHAASYYLHIGLRKAMECKFVNVAVNLGLDDKRETVRDVRIAMGAVAEKPIRVPEAEDCLKEKPAGEKEFSEAGRICAEAARPIDDFRASADYRRKIVKVLVQRALKKACSAIRQ